jgi:hypothetical protein
VREDDGDGDYNGTNEEDDLTTTLTQPQEDGDDGQVNNRAPTRERERTYSFALYVSVPLPPIRGA